MIVVTDSFPTLPSSSEDWTLETAGGTTLDAIQANFQTWFNGSKSPGLIILEHELYNESVQAFMNGFPVGMAAGWQHQSQALLAAVNASSKSPWQNAPPGNTGAVMDNTIGPNAGSGYPPPSTTSSGTPSTSAVSVSICCLLVYCGFKRQLLTALSDKHTARNAGAEGSIC